MESMHAVTDIVGPGSSSCIAALLTIAPLGHIDAEHGSLTLDA